MIKKSTFKQAHILLYCKLFICLLNFIWKCANVTSLAKVNNIEDKGKDLRPTSLTLL